MKRALTAAVLAAVLVGQAHAAPAKQGWPVTVGERGQRVCNVLFLLKGGYVANDKGKITGGNRYGKNPRFRIYKGTVPHKASKCVYTKAASKATSTLKYRLGYSKLFLGGQFGRKLYRYVVAGPDAKKRTESMLVIAGKRVVIDRKAAAKAAAEAAKLAWIPKLIGTEQHEVGVHETSTNYSDRIRVYQSVTGAYRAAWCMSFQQWGRVASGMSTIADRSAGVFYVVGYARNHGLAGSTPHPGDLAAFVDGLGHIGLVYKVDTRGYYTVEGNHSNAVADVFHPHGSRSVIFITASPKAPRS